MRIARFVMPALVAFRSSPSLPSAVFGDRLWHQ